MDITLFSEKTKSLNSQAELQEFEASIRVGSKEIAELAKKEHYHVLRDIREMLSEMRSVEDDPILDHLLEEQFDSRGYTSEIFLEEDLAVTLVSGYSARLRYKLVKQLRAIKEVVKAQQLLIEKQAEEKAALISEKLKIAQEAEAVADRKLQAAKDLLAIVKPSNLPKLVKDDPYWKDRCIRTLDAFLKDPKLSTYYAGEHDNAVKECVNVQDKLRAVLQFAKAHLRLKPESSGHKLPDCTEVLAYKRNLLT